MMEVLRSRDQALGFLFDRTLARLRLPVAGLFLRLQPIRRMIPRARLMASSLLRVEALAPGHKPGAFHLLFSIGVGDRHRGCWLDLWIVRVAMWTDQDEPPAFRWMN